MLSFCKSGLFFYFTLILFRLLLDVSYIVVISEVYSYKGYLVNFTISNYFLSWLLYVSSFYLLKHKLKEVSDYFFLMGVLSSIAPLSCFYGLDSERPIFPVLLSVLTFCLILLVTRVHVPFFRGLKVVRYGRGMALVFSLICVLYLVFWYSVSGVQLNLDFLRVYEFRRDNEELAAHGIYAYTNNWTYKVFSIFLMAFALHYKKFLAFTLLFIVQVYFFAASAHKSVFFFPFLIFGVWYYFKRTDRLVVIPVSFCLLILATLVSFILFEDLKLTSLFSRRVFFVPADLTYIYFDFFSVNPNVYWSNSILSNFLTYPYDLPVPYIVGRYLGDETMSANNGFIPMGFAHFGIAGLFLYGLIVGGVLRFVNDLSYNSMPVWLAVGLSIVPLRTLIVGSDLFTVLLTHGFIVAIFLIYLSRNKYG